MIDFLRYFHTPGTAIGRIGDGNRIARIEQWVRQMSGSSLSEAGVFPHVLHINEMAPLPLLNQLFEICNVPAEARSLRADA